MSEQRLERGRRMQVADKTERLRKIARLWNSATCPGEKAAAENGFDRAKYGTPYARLSVKEFLAFGIGQAFARRPWPTRRKSTTFTRTPEQQEALRREAERREEMRDRERLVALETVKEALAWGGGQIVWGDSFGRPVKHLVGVRFRKDELECLRRLRKTLALGQELQPMDRVRLDGIKKWIAFASTIQTPFDTVNQPRGRSYLRDSRGRFCRDSALDCGQLMPGGS
jgi:hypothetical protein